MNVIGEEDAGDAVVQLEASDYDRLKADLRAAVRMGTQRLGKRWIRFWEAYKALGTCKADGDAVEIGLALLHDIRNVAAVVHMHPTLSAELRERVEREHVTRSSLAAATAHAHALVARSRDNLAWSQALKERVPYVPRRGKRP